jgi:hypothetical protein
MMAQDVSPSELVDRIADERLLSEDAANLPEGVGRPEPIPPSRTRALVVGLGATLTGVTLVAGIALIAAGAIDALASGLGVLAVVALAVGAALVATHWGWVHVAEVTANAIESRRNSEILERRRQWLSAISPYTRYEVTTSAAEDGSISINRIRHHPVRSGARGFSFVREIESREVHSADEPAAAVAERAELLRREAARETERERERFEVAADAYERALMGRDDREQRLAARRAASQALSDQINANLRDPPLID